MLSVEDYRDRVLAGISRLAAIELPLTAVEGCVLAENVAAAVSLPSFDNSSMDGYAVLASDLASASTASPVDLRVIDDVPAGGVSRTTVTRGTAIRIMTGAAMPDGADAVIPVELTDAGTTFVQIIGSVNPGAYIRRTGEDVRAGAVVLPAGTLIESRQIALLAACGHGTVRVFPQPRIAVIDTGSELVEPGEPLGPGMIHDANSFMLISAAREAGAQAYRVGPIPDDDAAFFDAIEDQLHRCDLILTSGGVSMGAYDTVKAVLSKLGTVHFMKVAMQPGMPQGYGRIEGTPIITLPGNPVSSYVSFELFVRPAIRKMRGLSTLQRATSTAVCLTAMDSPRGKRQFARARFVDGGVEATGTGQGSHVLGGLADAEALIVIPEDTAHIDAGADVTVIDLR
jgi:molybdopterin molybdotransferase